MNDSNFNVKTYPALASFSIHEYVKTVPNGFETETLPCVLSLHGITSLSKNMRGWIETPGAGIQVNSDDLILRGSWVELDGDCMCVNFCDAPESIPALEQVRYIPLGGYKSLLVISGYAFCAKYLRMALPFDI